MAGRGEEVCGLFVNGFELIRHREDSDCSVDARADGGGCWDYHCEFRAGERIVNLDGQQDLDSDEGVDSPIFYRK